MATSTDADLIIKLYDLRREATMRKARNYYFTEFFPKNIDDVIAQSTEHQAYFRQVTSYWEMVAAMVNHGCIDKALFFDTDGEFMGVWSKISDFIGDLRKQMYPGYLANLEKLIDALPNSAERIKMIKERFNAMRQNAK